MTRSLRLACACALGLSFVSAHAQTIADWTFQTDAIATNNTPNADIGTGTASSLGMNIYATPNVGVTANDVLAGKSTDTGNNGVADTTQVWRIRAQAGSSGAANGWSSAAPIATQGAEFQASTAGVNAPITVSFDWYATTQGEANLQLQYTTNGSTWTNIALTLGGHDTGLLALTNSNSPNTVLGSYVSDSILNPGQSAVAGQDWFTGLTATINDPLAQNNASFAVRMVNASTGVDNVSTQGTALNNNSGNWRFDNVAIAAVPEPNTWVMLGFAGLVLVAAGRRKPGGAVLAA